MNIDKLVFRGAFPSKAKRKEIEKQNKFILSNKCYKKCVMGSTHFHSIIVEPEDSAGIILYCHSNASILGVMLLRFANFLSKITSRTVVVVEYPGFGLSTDSCTLENIFQTVEAAANFFQTGPYEGKSLILYGRSIGCTIACNIASRIPSIEGIILESPISSLQDVIGIPSFFLGSAMKEKCSKLGCIVYMPNISCPKCLIYGTKDQFSRERSIKKVLKFFHSNDWKLELRNFGHNNIPSGSTSAQCSIASPSCFCCGCCIVSPAVESAEEEYRDTIHSFVESIHLVSTTRNKISTSAKQEDQSSLEIEMVPCAPLVEELKHTNYMYCGIPRDE